MGNRVLIRGRWVLTGGTASDPVMSDAAVVIEGDTVHDLGDSRAMLAAYPDAEVLGSPDVAILPGLINAHHHSHGVSTIQHGVSDDLLEPWLLAHARTRSSDIYLNTLLSVARELRSGVTTVVDVHSGGGSADQYGEALDGALRAYDEAGMRVAFATGVSTQSFLVHGKGEDQRFLGGLPPELRSRAARRMPAPGRISEDAYLEIVEQRVRAYQNHPRIDVWYAPPGPQWVSDTLMQRIAERAERLDTNVQTHGVESIYEMLHGPRLYGQPTVLHLRDLGVLSPRFSLAHGVWLKEREIEVLAETGAAVSHNPSSNLRLRAGIAPLNAMLASGMTVGLGMDGTTINEDEDMFAEMRLAMRLHRTPMINALAPSPPEVFGMATAGGAKLMRKDHEIGRIAPGYRADLVVVNLREITWPWVAPEADPGELVLMRAHTGDVDTVLVGGDVVLKNGRPTRFDVQAVADELAAKLAAASFPDEHARLVADLAPHLEAWYANWNIPELDPYIRYNSKR